MVLLCWFRLILAKLLAGSVLWWEHFHYWEALQIFACYNLFPSGCASVIFYTGTSSSTGDLSIPVVSNRDNASPAWCFTLARRTTSKSNIDARKLHLASFPVVYLILCTHQIASWSVRSVNRDLFEIRSEQYDSIRQ